MNWLWVFFEICNAFFGVLMIKMLAESFLRDKQKLPMWSSIIILLTATCISFLISTFMNGNFLIVSLKTVLVAFIISYVFCRSKIYWHGIVAFLYCLLGSGFEILSAYIITIPQNIQISDVVEMNSYRYQTVIVADLLVFMTVKIISRIRKGDVYDIPLKIWAVLCLLPIFSILTTLQIVFNSASDKSSISFLSVLSVLGLLYTNVLIFSLVESVIRQSANNKKIIAFEAQLAVQKEHNLKLAESRTQVQQLSHDFKHHVQALKFLCEAAQFEELSKSISDLAERQKYVKPMLDTGNPYLDSVLTAKRESAEQANIQWSWNIQIPAELPIPFIDLNSILCNALDNAIEACLRTEDERFISLDIHTSDNVLLCEVKNSVGQPPKMHDGHLKTLKTDIQHHGIGLRSISECCKRLGGQMSYDFDESIFELRFLIPF